MIIRAFEETDWEELWTVLQPVLRAGETYAFPTDIDSAGAHQAWVRAVLETYVLEAEGHLLGTYYLKPNHPGPGSHVCNCGYLVAEKARGRGYASRLCEHSQRRALELGFRAMQYNLVAAANRKALRLWQHHGFPIVGRLPGAFHSTSLGDIDAFVMFKTLQREGLSFRAADIHDLELLQEWDKEPHVVAGDPHDDWQWESELVRHPPWRHQLIAQRHGRPIGFVQIIDPALEDSHYWGDCPEGLRAIDIWLGDPDDLGKGYGTQLMAMAIEWCFATPTVAAILIDPLADNTGAHTFYERFGFKFLEERRFGLDHCRVYQLNRPDWEAHHRIGRV